MPETILGLDIGPETIKAVAVTRKGRTDILVWAAEAVRLDACGDLEAALKVIAAKMRISSARCVISLPPADVMFRQVVLPFRDDGRIKKTLAFELEPLLPVDEIVFDYMKLPGKGLLAAAVAKEKIRPLIARVEETLGQVIAVDVSGSVLALPVLDKKAANIAGILLDVGESASAAVFYDSDAIIQMRSFAFGGKTITESLALDLVCDKEEAESMKIRGSYAGTIGRATETCRRFCEALKNTVEFLRLSETLRHEPVQITVTGGGSLFPPLQKELESTFGLPLKVLDVARMGTSEIDARLRGGYAPQNFNTAVAAARRAFTSQRSFNFRQGEFAARNDFGTLKGLFKRFAVVGVVIVSLIVADVYLDYRLQDLRAADLKRRISLLFKKNSPQTVAIVDPAQQLKTQLAENKKTYGMYGGLSEVTVVEMLKEISGLIAPSFDLMLTNFYYENKLILIKGEAGSMDDISAVKNELTASPYFKNVALGSTSLTKEGSKVDFDLRIELK
ncbi:MAG: hypothetical protein EHM85_10410 [Desulfobacteraceae bacterium]|nr:MAG: hypothetical protein EHM85_10410 [Desulfobacteraceae bacterium]